jgi:aminopeptidase N
VGSAYEPGAVTVHIRYRGVIRDSCCGFYRTNAGNFRYGVMYSSARNVFPSFDDPTAKATFDIAATVDASDDAISNGRLVSDTSSTNRNYHTLKFATTPRMSTYLVTIAIGQFECEAGESDGVPIRVCGHPNEKGLGSAALEAAKFTLHFYDQYFETKYPYGKLDFVALPGIPGAMEDVGCILAEGSTLLGRPDDGEWSKNMAIGPVAHEMAHQWLGDLVTPLSDEDGWLSEGMATWMQYKAVAAWKPGWKIEMDQLLRTFAAMEVDSLRTTPPVRSLDPPDQIEYDKSAAVIRMIEAYVGPAAFRTGINSHIARHAYSNASGEELWDEIAKASKLPVDRIAEGFITESGVPVVAVTAKCIQSRTQVDVKQDRFLSNPSDVQPIKPTLWQIPVCLKLNGKTKCELLVSPEQQFVLDGCGAVFANAGATGYCQSTYDSHDLSALTLGVESSLSPEERLALLNDSWAQVRVGQEDAGAYLALTERLNSDEEPGVLRLIDNDLGYLQDYIVADSDQMNFETWVRKTFSSRAEQAIRHSGDSPMDAQSELLKIAGIIGHDSEVVGFSRKVAIDALNAGVGDPLLVSTAFEIATPTGDDSLYNKLRAALTSSKDPGERIRYIQSLARFENPRLIQSTVAMLTSTELNVGEARGLRSFLFRNRVARPMVWQFLVDHWEQFQSRHLVTAGMFEDLAQFCDAPTRVDIERFFTKHKISDFESSITQVLTRIKACEDVRLVQQPKLVSWLEKQKVASEGNRP